MRDNLLLYRIDWMTSALYLLLALGGWLSIYAADYDPDLSQGIFNFTMSSGKQLVWIGVSLVVIVVIMFIDFKIYHSAAYIFYGITLLLLLFVLFFGQEIAGNKSWFVLGPVKFQPSEITKYATALTLSRYLSQLTLKGMELRRQVIGFSLFLFPAVLVLLEGDLGTAMVFGGLIIVLFREGLHPYILVSGVGIVILFLATLLVNQTVLLVAIVLIGLLVIGLASKSPLKIAAVIIISVSAIVFVRSVDFIMTEVLKPHQQKRVMSLINPNADPLGIGWNVTQSKIAIGSGGLIGKGYLEGTQTKFDFVPEQTTDFIFCTIGEEQGWLGSSLLIVGFSLLFLRLIYLAERQKSHFARIYGYCVLSILFFHFAVNIAMTIGLFPVIGIPLPFFSYGGSSLVGFTVLLFTFLKLDAHRMQVLQRN